MYLTKTATFVAPVRPLASVLALDPAPAPFALDASASCAGTVSWQSPLTGPSSAPRTSPFMRHIADHAANNSIASTDASTNATAASAVAGVRGNDAEVVKQAAPPRGRPR